MKPCIVCGAGEHRALFEKQDIPYFRCRSCGFVHSEPERNVNFPDALEEYEASYLQYLEETREDNLNYDALLGWLEGHASWPGARALDVGAGSGKLVRYLRARGWEVQGVEPAGPLFERFLREDSAFFDGTLEQFAACEPEPFDVIFICDVIEHVADPGELLARASALLASDGIVVVSTPDLASWLARLSGRRWHFFNRYHLSYLSRDTLGLLAQRCALQEVAFAHHGRRRSLGYVLRYLLDFVAGGASSRVPRALDRLSVSVNPGDTMTAVFARGQLS